MCENVSKKEQHVPCILFDAFMGSLRGFESLIIQTVVRERTPSSRIEREQE